MSEQPNSSTPKMAALMQQAATSFPEQDKPATSTGTEPDQPSSVTAGQADQKTAKRKPRKKNTTPLAGSPLVIPTVTPPDPGIISSFVDLPPADRPASPSTARAPVVPRETEMTPEQMLEDRLNKEEVADKVANRKLRDKYSKRAYSLARGCICFWMVVVATNGVLSAALPKPPISDNVIFALTTGVTVNVLAAFLGVIRGLFPTSWSTRDALTQGKKGNKKIAKRIKKGKNLPSPASQDH
ncbi:hypothetical protein [Chromobacterium amazonense]|uniref:SMODS and SLOG-associating 2TM effector domain-containing protein n=1 Tax=Chromobacterium amazonense TaxID=1382803 RepID=A0ABU8UX54_9NEIS|nr:hypothetical protein [Chromobacterium amazonense]MDQ4541513.1 hypothetical protein [Chromobacterium amazonense]